MLPEKRTKTNVAVGTGLLLQLAGLFLVQTEPPAAILGIVLILVSIPFFILGCMYYAEGKGHSKWVGLVGLAGVIGLIALILLPDQSRPGSVPRSQLRKLIGLISIVAGIGLAVLGVWLHHLGEDVELERLLGLWPGICMLLGFCIAVVGSLMLTLGSNGSDTDTRTVSDDRCEDAICMSCQATIPAGSDTCPNCGSSYDASKTATT